MAFDSKQYAREYYQKNRESLRLRFKKYYQEHREAIVGRSKEWKEKNKEKSREHNRKVTERNRKAFPEKAAARLKVSRAISSGRLYPMPCEICGDPKAEAHHGDYSLPLSVQWFCSRHHKQLHRIEKATKDMSNEVFIIPERLDYANAEVIKSMKATVARGLTDAEFVLFLQLCKSTGLNPFKKEIWAIKTSANVQIMVGINGYLAIANRHPQFDGMEVSLDYDGAALRSATCKVYRKDRKYPSVAVALMSEWGGSTPIWKQKPSVMLSKVAKSVAIREAFALELAGTYTEEEMPREFAAPAQPMPSVSVVPADSLPQATRLYKYSIAAIEPEKLEDVFAYLESQGAYESEEPGLWYSEKRLPKLAKHEVTDSADSVAA